MKPRLSLSKVKSYFEHVYPQLFSRIRRLSRRFPDSQEAIAEMVGFSWLNLLSKARRTGQLLTPGALAWIAYRRHRSGRTLAQHSCSVKDVLSPLCYRSGRVRVFLFSQVAAPVGRREPDDEIANSIALALSTREKDRPDVRATTRLDWSAFAKLLPTRLRNILRWLSLGFTKTEISRRLRLSPGRVSQLLYVIGDELKAYFGPGIVPVAA